MKISDIIDILRRIHADHGDLPVAIRGFKAGEILPFHTIGVNVQAPAHKRLAIFCHVVDQNDHGEVIDADIKWKNLDDLAEQIKKKVN